MNPKRIVAWSTVALAAMVTLTISCAHHWSAFPTNVHHDNRCNSLKSFPQMVKIPGYKQAWHIVDNCSYYPREKVSIAMSVFYVHWVTQFGDHNSVVKNNLNSLMIQWNSRYKSGTGYDVEGVKRVNASIKGMTLTKKYVWVKTKNADMICNTSLVHELVHASIWASIGNNGDPDHLGNKYRGWTLDHSALIQKANEELCTLGI